MDHDKRHPVHDTACRIREVVKGGRPRDDMSMEIMRDLRFHILRPRIEFYSYPTCFGDQCGYILLGGVQQVVRGADSGVACERHLGVGSEDVDMPFLGIGGSGQV